MKRIILVVLCSGYLKREWDWLFFPAVILHTTHIRRYIGIHLYNCMFFFVSSIKGLQLPFQDFVRTVIDKHSKNQSNQSDTQPSNLIYPI